MDVGDGLMADVVLEGVAKKESGYPADLDLVGKGAPGTADSLASIVVDEGVKAPRDASGLFANLLELTFLDLSGLDSTDTTNMSGMFEGDGGLCDICLDGLNTKKVESMASMFNGCGALEMADLSSFDTSALTDIGEMFFDCYNLKTSYVSYEFDFSCVSREGNVFRLCYNLTGGMGTDQKTSLTNKDYARIDGGEQAPGFFTNGSERGYLTKIGDWEYYLNNAGGVTLTGYTGEEAGENTDIVIPGRMRVGNASCPVSLRRIGKGSRWSADNPNTGTPVAELTSIRMEKEVVATSDASNMFFGCAKVKQMDLSNLNTDNVENMDDMFCRCSALEELDLSSWSGWNVTSMDDTFYDCSSMKHLYLSGFRRGHLPHLSQPFWG
jgi:surface protein